ncbi:MAG: pteridine reductase [Betaproteobacteria bacterium]|nr:MAG: pteridine reductase [Betaproteobacteria bacterium]TAG46520.1 MAG: pteridine reductase [Betaproteobacteria bacterium]TAG76876.1 MAG: pteridine reductase [Betaproteobacteria bacterium]
MTNLENAQRVALITGGARRVGAAIVRRLHAEGFRVAIHYRASFADADALARELNAIRADSAAIFAADLLEFDRLASLVESVVARFGRLDGLINNASTFYGGTLESVDDTSWRELIGSNLQAPVYLSKAAAPHLKLARGCIVNITDIHTERPMPDYVLYNVAKSGLRGLTLALARDLAPQVRVNAVAPGPIEWPDQAQIDMTEQARILAQVPLGGEGGTEQIAAAVKYLVCDATYVTGHTINVDGGRSIAL